MEAELINAALAALAGCVCSELEQDGDFCFCGVSLGDEYIAMSGVGDCEDKCGEAWVRLVSANVGDILGQPQDVINNCSSPLSLTLEVGVLRCFKMEDDGEAPTQRDLLCAATEQINDMVTIKRAVGCCDHFTDVLFSSWTPMGPTGGLVGGAWTVVAGL